MNVFKKRFWFLGVALLLAWSTTGQAQEALLEGSNQNDETSFSDDVAEHHRTLPSNAVNLSGVLMRIGGCTALDVYSGLPSYREVFLDWGGFSSRSDWLHTRFDAHLEDFGSDMWRAWQDLGGGVERTDNGIRLSARWTGEFEQCGLSELPIMRVERVIGTYNNLDQEDVDEDSQPIAESFDLESETTQQILDARDGTDLTLVVRGITDPSLGCPPWRIESVFELEDPLAASNYAFIELEYASAELAPHPKWFIPGLYEERDVDDPSDLSRGALERLMVEATRRSLRGPFVMSGHLTTEIRRWRGYEALYLTPVFVVTSIDRPDLNRELKPVSSGHSHRQRSDESVGETRLDVARPDNSPSDEPLDDGGPASAPVESIDSGQSPEPAP